jgi:pimeloyl-ACP methyl ester carboxylesterase
VAPLTPLAGNWLERVTLPGGTDAYVSIPNGATEPRPLVVAAHGAGDRPEWACGEWRGITTAYAFIVCPHGTASSGAFHWSSVEQLEREAGEAEAAVRARYGAHVDPAPAVFAGFSQGARIGALVAARHPERYGAVVLAEGGWDEGRALGPALSRRLPGARRGRVLLACTTGACATRFGGTVEALRHGGVDHHLADLGYLGHQMGPEVTSRLRHEWRWLVRDDERWEPWLESPEPE